MFHKFVSKVKKKYLWASHVAMLEKRIFIFVSIFNKTIILLRLAEYEIIITNLGLFTLLLIYHLIFGKPR